MINTLVAGYEMLKEFLGYKGYTREPEGFLSWQHLTFVTLLMVCMVTLAVILGMRYRKKSQQSRNKVLMVSAILMDSLEFIKVVLFCAMKNDWMNWLYQLPCYLCSIQLITLPLAAFSRGKVKSACFDFVCIFGIIGALLGTYGAGQNYSAYPVLSFDNVVSGLTHSISGFASLYILFAKMEEMKKRNLYISCGIILSFSVVAYGLNMLLDSNYMFLMRGDGTPYDILYNLISGHAVWYPLGVVMLFFLYIVLFYRIYWQIRINATFAEE